MKTFINVAQMKLATLQAGQFVETGGYYTKGDAGQAKYLIVAAQAADEKGDHTLANGTVAVLQVDGGVDVKQFGAKGDGITDDILPIQAAVNTVHAAGGGIVKVPEGHFITTTYIKLLDNVYIDGDGYGSHINNIAVSGFSKVVIASGNLGDPTNGNSMFDEVSYDIDSVNTGDFEITFITPTDVNQFSVDDIVCLQSFEQWPAIVGRSHGKYLHQNIVTKITGSTLSFRYAVTDDYPSSAGNRPIIQKISGNINGYDGNPFFMGKNCGAKNLRLTQAIGLTSGWYALFPSGINQHYDNISMDNCSSLVGSNNLSFSSFKKLQGSFEAGAIDLSEFQNNVTVDGVIANRIAANPSLNRVGLAANNGADVTFKNIEVSLGGWGRGASVFTVHRGLIRNVKITGSGGVGDTDALQAILLGYGNDCSAIDNEIIEQHKNGITVVGPRAIVRGNKVIKTNVGYFAGSANSAVDTYFVYDNIFGVAGSRNPQDVFSQAPVVSPQALIYNNDDYYETSKKDRANWAGYAQTSGTTHTTLQTNNLRGTSGIERGLRLIAIGARNGLAGAKAVNLKLGNTTLATVNYLAADNGFWRLEAIINVRANTDATHYNAMSYMGVDLQEMNYAAITNGLVSDTTISVEAQCANASDSVSIFQFIVEPINLI